MASYLNASGDFYNGIWTLVPEECYEQVDPNSASQQGSEQFLVDRWSEYVASLMVDLVPGIVLGSISAAGCLIFLAWAVFRWRRRRRIRAARLAKHAQSEPGQPSEPAPPGDANGDAGQESSKPQVLATSPSKPAGPAAQPAEFTTTSPEQAQPQSWGQRCWHMVTAGRVLKWLIVLTALATVGVSAWGIASSVTATDGLVDSFWLLVNRAQELVLDLEEALDQLGQSLGEVSGTLDTVQNALLKIVDTVNSIPIIGGLIGKALPMDKINEFVGPKADEAIGALNGASTTINGTILPLINDHALPAIDSVMRNEGWTTKLQDQWRFIVIAVLFGLLILLAAAVAVACFRMRRGVTSAALVSLLWGLNAVIMFLGFGLLNGAKTVATDACLYSEDYVSRLVEQRLEGDTREMVTAALDYYLGKVDLVDVNGQPLLTNGTAECDAALTAALLRQVAGIELHSALVFAWQAAELLPDISNLLGGINLPTIPFVNFDLDTIKQPVMTASDQLQGTLEDICNVTLLLVRENNIWPLYVDTKAYVCCDLTRALEDVWLPWTVTGVLTLVLCLLASLRVVTSALRPSGMPAPAAGSASGVQLAELGAKQGDGEAGHAAEVQQMTAEEAAAGRDAPPNGTQ